MVPPGNITSRIDRSRSLFVGGHSNGETLRRAEASSLGFFEVDSGHRISRRVQNLRADARARLNSQGLWQSRSVTQLCDCSQSRLKRSHVKIPELCWSLHVTFSA